MESDPLRFIECKAFQIGKLLLDSLLLAKDAWKVRLLGSPEGLCVLQTIEEAEDEFVDPTITEPFARLDNVLDVIVRRARAFVVPLDYVAKSGPAKSRDG